MKVRWQAGLADVRNINNVGACLPGLQLLLASISQYLLKEAWGACIYIVLEVINAIYYHF